MGKVVRGEYLPLHQREIDLDLVEPTRMHWSMKQDEVGVSLGQPSDCGLSSVRRAVVHHPEDAFRGTVGLTAHDLRNQPPKRLDSGSWLATAHHNAASDVPCREVLNRTATIVLELNT